MLVSVNVAFFILLSLQHTPFLIFYVFNDLASKFAAQAQEPRLDPQHPHKKLGLVLHAYNARAGEAGTGGS